MTNLLGPTEPCRLYCITLLAVAPKALTDELRGELNAAARVVSGTRKYHRGLTRLRHSVLHWFHVTERVAYKLGVMTYGCLHGQAPQYLMELCLPVSGVSLRQHLRSTTRRFVRFSAMPPQHIRLRCLLGGRPVGLEFTVREFARSSCSRDDFRDAC